MELKMVIGDRVVDSIAVNFSKMGKPGYLEGLRDKLIQKHLDIIDVSAEKPQYYIDNVPSGMNKRGK